MNKPKYIVKPLYMSGKGKKQFRSGDEVSENDFTPEDFHKRVKDGDLTPIERDGEESKDSNEDSNTDTDNEPSSDADMPTLDLLNDSPLLTIERDGEEIEIFKLEDFKNKAELTGALKSNDIEFDPSDNKPVLFDLLVEKLK